MNFLQKLWPAFQYGESILPVLFNTKSHNSGIVYTGESLTREGSLFNNFEGLPLPLRGHRSKKIG